MSLLFFRSWRIILMQRAVKETMSFKETVPFVAHDFHNVSFFLSSRRISMTFVKKTPPLNKI